MERRREADGLADLADARRVAPLADLGVDELEHLPLAGGERARPARVGCGERRDGLAWALSHGPTVTRSRVRGKHPFDIFLDVEQAFVQRSCLTPVVRSSRQHRHRFQEPPTGRSSSELAAADTLDPPSATRASTTRPSRLPAGPPRAGRRSSAPPADRRAATEPPPSTDVGVGSSPSLLGLGLVLAVGTVRARRSAGPPSPPPSAARTSSTVVVEPGDTLWSIAAARSPPTPIRAPSSTRSSQARGTAALLPGRDAHLARRLTRRVRARHGDRGATDGTGATVDVVRCPVLPGERRQGRRLAPRRRRRRDPAPARVPRVRPPLHHLRAGRGGPLVVRKRVGASEPFDRAKLRAGDRAGGDGPARRRRRSTRSSPRSRRSCATRAARSRASGSGWPCSSGCGPSTTVAYLRFASVYKGFEDLADFEREVGELQKTTAPDARSAASASRRPRRLVHACTSANLRERPLTSTRRASDVR